jgi:hypothetical protein
VGVKEKERKEKGRRKKKRKKKWEKFALPATTNLD